MKPIKGILGNRRGASTVEYVGILIGVLALGMVLYYFVMDEGQTTVKDKIIAIINGEESGGSTELGSGETENENIYQRRAPKREQVDNVNDVGVTDEQLRRMSDIVYEDIEGLTDGDFSSVFGFDERGRPIAEIIERQDLDNGFQAIAVRNRATGEIVISFRGSDTDNNAIDWWGQDATILTQTPGVQEQNARRFVEMVQNNPRSQDSSIVLTGHSLGGFHAQLAAKETGLPAVTFNAPGLKPNPAGSMGTIRRAKDAFLGLFNPRINVLDDFNNARGANDDQVINYVNDGDAIGNFGIHYGRTVVTGDGEPRERNDYLSPIAAGDLGAIFRGGGSAIGGGFGQIGEEHSLDSFDGQFGNNGNISR